VPIARVQIAVVPTDPPRAGAAPRTLYLATDAETFRIALPADGWVKPGKTFEVTLPTPVQSSCLSLVLDTAYTRGLAHPDVSVSEVVAYSEFDGPGVTLDDVASRLSSPRGPAAAQVLERAGRGSLPAVEKVYDALEERGRALAMDVAASHEKCEDAVPLLTHGLCEPEGQAPRKAREKLGRCKEAGAGLAAALRSDAARRACLAPVLAQVAPESALAPLAEAMGSTPEADHATRETLRAAFATALEVGSPGHLAPLLADPKTPLAARLDVVRAAGPRVAEAPAETSAVIGQLLEGAPPVRTRYLLLEPLAELARAGDKAAAARLADAVARDADWPVRARAAELGARLPEVAPALGAAAHDPEPRVREAALGSLAQAPTAEGVQAAAAALVGDHWPFVRAQAVAVLAGSGPSRAADDALGGALEDRSPRVRGGAMLALGRRRATSWRDKVRDRLDDKNEEGDVRAEAAWALGAMCDAGSLDRLTQLARVLPVPDATEEARQIGLAALISLAALKPGDLGKRIAPLLAKTAPADVQKAAEKAMSARGTCR
jgi:HEAT repeat protein